MTAPRSEDKISATEQCGCGASITAETFSISGLNAILQQWREGHTHQGGGPPPPPPPPPWLRPPRMRPVVGR